MGNNQLMRKELQEAIYAGENALEALKRAQNKLNSARGWGLFDLFGGGFLSSAIKHSRMNEAASCVDEARLHLQRFQRELQDVNMSLNLNMQIGGFLSFADFFFDGVIADYLVQSKIADARRQVDEAITQVERLIQDLKVKYGMF